MTNNILPHRRFNYFAMQGTKAIPGTCAVFGTVLIFGPYAVRDQVEELCLNHAAHLAVDLGIPWNPFQVSLVFTPVK